MMGSFHKVIYQVVNKRLLKYMVKNKISGNLRRKLVSHICSCVCLQTPRTHVEIRTLLCIGFLHLKEWLSLTQSNPEM